MHKHGVGTPNKFDAFAVVRPPSSLSKIVIEAAVATAFKRLDPSAEVLPTDMYYRPTGKMLHDKFMDHLQCEVGLFEYQTVRSYNRQAEAYWEDVKAKTPTIEVAIGSIALSRGRPTAKRVIAATLDGENVGMLVKERNAFLEKMNASFGGGSIDQLIADQPPESLIIGTIQYAEQPEAHVENLNDMLQGRTLVLEQPIRNSLKYRQCGT